MLHFKAFGVINLQYEIRICHKIHDKGTMSKFQHKLLSFKVGLTLAKNSDAASGWAGWAFAHPKFGVTVNPNQTRGADYAHCIYC